MSSWWSRPAGAATEHRTDGPAYTTTNAPYYNAPQAFQPTRPTMNGSSICSKTGKGMLEASGKSSVLSRADRAVLAQVDGKTTLSEISKKFEKIPEAKFFQLLEQLAKDGFVREVASSAAPAPSAPKPAAPPSPPAAADSDEDLDFTAAVVPPPKPAAPKPPMDLAAHARAASERSAQEDPLNFKARQEAEAKLALAAQRAKIEAEVRAKAAAAAQARAQAEAKAKAEEHARVEAELKAKLEEERAKAEAEAKAKAEAEAKAKAEAEAKAKAEAEAKAKAEAEAKAKAEAEAKAKAEAEAQAKAEAEAKAKAEAEAQAKAEAEAKAKAEAEAKAKAEAEAQAKAEAEAKAKAEAEAKAKAEAEAKAKAEAEAQAKAEAEAQAKAEAEAKAKAEAEVPAKPAASATDSLLADLDSFSMRDDEERERQEAEDKTRKAAEEKARAEAEAKAKLAAEEKKRHEEEESRRKAEEERLAREEEERKVREEAARKAAEEEERKRKAQESMARHQVATGPAPKPSTKKPPVESEDDLDISDEDLDLEDIKADEKKLGKDRKKDQEARDRIDAAALKASKAADSVLSVPNIPVKSGRPKKWGKPVAIVLFVLVLCGLGLLHLIPLSSSNYERLVSEAIGRPVKIGTLHLSIVTGVEIRTESLSIGDGIRAGAVRAVPQLGSLFAEKKAFSLVSIEGLVIPQEEIGKALFGGLKGDGLKVARVTVTKAKLMGALPLPELDLDVTFGEGGAVQSVGLKAADSKLVARIQPQSGSAAVEVSAGSLSVPFVPGMTLSDFGMKGTATAQELVVSAWDGKLLDGAATGTARIRWGARWSVEGEMRVRQMNASVLSPALMSDGKADAQGVFAMSGTAPDKLAAEARLEGRFAVTKGVLGSFDLARAIQPSATQAAGRTLFSELSGVGTYNKGAVQLRDMKLTAGLLTANGILDIDATGRLAGRINADLGAQHGAIALSGTAKDPKVSK